MDPPLAICFVIPLDLNKGNYILQGKLAKKLSVHLKYCNILILTFQSRIWLCSREEKNPKYKLKIKFLKQCTQIFKGW